MRSDIFLKTRHMNSFPGEEVCKILKKDEDTTNIPIIMLTGKDSDVDKIVGMVIGADAYIPKPFDMDKLFNEVSRFLFWLSRSF